ncbi:MAG: DUF3883 domain-containing protein [Bacteroidota bacterium]
MHPIDCFSTADIRWFMKLHAENRKTDTLSEQEVEKIKGLFNKANYWAQHAATGSLVCREDNYWQNSRHLKKYSWPKLFDPNHEDKLIYFIFGFNTDGVLYYKIDCQWSKHMNEHLSAEQVERFNLMVNNSGAKLNEIRAEKLSDHNWNSLIQTARAFVKENMSLYYDIIDYVWNSSSSVVMEEKQAKKPKLDYTPPPQVPEKFEKRKFAFEILNSAQDIPFEQQARSAKLIGDAGEKFILDVEAENLKRLGIDKVPEKRPDGAGYDILSYDENGDELHIEVKTTPSNDSRKPFYMSSNELEYLKRHANAVIYRVYDFDLKSERGKVFRLSYEDLENYLVEPREYKIYLS